MEKQITSIFSLQPREKKAMLMVLMIIVFGEYNENGVPRGEESF